MRRFGLLGFTALLLLVGAVGVVSYNLGVSAGAADAAIAAGASVIYTAGAGISPFALILGLFFLVLVIALVARSFAGPRMAMGAGSWGHRSHRGRGGWDHDEVPEPFRPMLERWHREAHTPGDSTGTAGTTSIGTPGISSTDPRP